jgi:hypothetical protein
MFLPIPGRQGGDVRELTLDERISIRGIFADRGISGPELLKAGMSGYIHYWGMVLPGSIAEWHLPKYRIRNFKHMKRWR